MIFSCFVKVRRFLWHTKIESTVRKFPYVVRAYKFMYHHLRPNGEVLLRLQTFQMCIDVRDPNITESLLTFGVYAPHQTALFGSLVEKGMVVIDVGAHVGYYTLLAASRVGHIGKVFAFEPEDKNFALLCRNIKLNGFRNVLCVQKVVSNRSGMCRLHLSPDNMGGHSIFRSHDDGRSVEVEAVTLDDFFSAGDTKVDVIKIDAEGAEPAILEGMGRLLARCDKLAVFTEFFPTAIRASGHSPQEYVDKLAQCGFVIYYIDEKGQSLKLTDPCLVMKELQQEPSMNLLCLRGMSL